MNEHVEEMVTYIQERCLWQFFSRSWDREENIEGILTRTTEILIGESSVVETDADRCWFADAKILASDFKSHFTWLKQADNAEIRTVMNGIKERMLEITVKKSHNEELNISNY